MSETIPVEAAAYRAAMARVASAVHLVTTDGPGGRAGFTASAVCSVSDAPPTLLVCVKRDSSAHRALSLNDSLCVNTLSADQQPVADAFAGGLPMAERFAAATWHEETGGPAVLAGVLVAFRCRIASRASVGTHEVLFCEVVGLTRPGETDALLYADRRYHTLPARPRVRPPRRA